MLGMHASCCGNLLSVLVWFLWSFFLSFFFSFSSCFRSAIDRSRLLTWLLSKRKISKRLVFVNLEFVVVMCITVFLLVAMEGARSCFQSVVCYS